MEPLKIFWLVCAVALLSYPFIYIPGRSIWCAFDHTKKGKYAILDKNAQIINMYSQKVQWTKNGAKFKTTVCFSDGFTFITHKTDREDGFFQYKISVDNGKILRLANKAHTKAWLRQEKRNSRKRK